MMLRLPLADEFIAAVRAGRKSSTIRAGKKSYLTGPALLVSSRQTVPVEIAGLSVCKVSELTQEDATTDGFLSVEELRDALSRFYPRLRDDDPVTIVRFRLAQ